MKRSIGAILLTATSSQAFTSSTCETRRMPLHSTVLDEAESMTIPSAGEALILGENYAKQETSMTPKSYLDDGFIYGLDDSGLERPKGKSANVVVEGDSLETTPFQVGLVSSTFAVQAFFAANAVHTLFEQTNGDVGQTAAFSIATIAASWVAADFGSGVFHWSVDNYGNGRTPIVGNIIAAFQGHHSAPWTIAYRGFCNNVYKLCIPFGIPTVAAINYLAGDNSMAALFFTFFCWTEIMSQELHKWSHQTKAEVPPVVNLLQDLGITIGRVPHAKHHTAPFEGNYCIVSGLCNESLDRSGFFRWMEHTVYKINGIESNAWKLDPELKERTLSGKYAMSE